MSKLLAAVISPACIDVGGKFCQINVTAKVAVTQDGLILNNPWKENLMLTLRAFLLSLLIFNAGLAAAGDEININSANAEMIAAAMNGIGIKRAEEIVAFREKNGDFKSVDDLVLVKGIGAATLDKNRDRIGVK
ncbi:MAG: helix-hairpin-helix domain-containing protein [Pseudomonadota bacterium]